MPAAMAPTKAAAKMPKLSSGLGRARRRNQRGDVVGALAGSLVAQRSPSDRYAIRRPHLSTTE